MGISYTNLNGVTKEISDDFKWHGTEAVWNALIKETKEGDNTFQEKMLQEAHSIICAVLYGKINKEVVK